MIGDAPASLPLAPQEENMRRTFVMANVYAVLVIGTFLGLLPALIVTLTGPLELDLALPLRVGFAVLGLAGGALSYTCMTVFVVKGDGTAFPTDPPKKFVAVGPYAYVRNPMYIGNIVLGLGIGAVVQSLTYLLYVAGLTVAIYLYVTRHEEPRLRERFGESYLAYCDAVHGWIPGPR
jgi:protein-S-isoprenylcysteine O-methyltransferase Ste14